MSNTWRRILVAGGFGTGVAMVASLALLAYALLSGGDGESDAAVSQITPTATPEPRLAATPEAIEEAPPWVGWGGEPTGPPVEEQPPPELSEPPPETRTPLPLTLTPPPPTPTVATECPNVVPGTYFGAVLIDGAVAPDGTSVVALVEETQRATTQTANGMHVSTVPDFWHRSPPCFSGGILSFVVDGRLANESLEWSPGPHGLDLTVGPAAPPPLTQTPPPTASLPPSEG